jgi:ribosomal-protein-alanine N-acetyltransferase
MSVVERLRWWDLEEVGLIEPAAFGAREAWSREQLWAELAGVPGRRCYLVVRDEDGGPVRGYAGAVVGGDVADVVTLAVHPQARRRGLGAALLRALLDAATQRGAHELALEVRADNTAARTLYARSGFERIGLRRGYYPDGTDGLVLRRRLRPGSPGGLPHG